MKKQNKEIDYFICIIKICTEYLKALSNYNQNCLDTLFYTSSIISYKLAVSLKYSVYVIKYINKFILIISKIILFSFTYSAQDNVHA